MLRALITAAILTLGVSPTLQGQIPTLPTRPGDPADTVTVNPFRIQPPISPMGALWRSILAARAKHEGGPPDAAVRNSIAQPPHQLKPL